MPKNMQSTEKVPNPKTAESTCLCRAPTPRAVTRLILGTNLCKVWIYSMLYMAVLDVSGRRKLYSVENVFCITNCTSLGTIQQTA